MSSDSPIELDDRIEDQPMESQTEESQQTQYINSQPADDSSSHVDAYSSSRALAALTLRLKAPAVSEFAPDAMPSLHLLPCRIAHTGPAAVPNYFRPAKAAQKAPVLTYGVDGAELKQASGECYDARFRGRQITGTVLHLPATAKGFVFEEDHNQSIDVDAADESNESDTKEQTQQPQTVWKTSATFSSFMLWQPDQEEMERNHIRESVADWSRIARAIHDPVTVPA